MTKIFTILFTIFLAGSVCGVSYTESNVTSWTSLGMNWTNEAGGLTNGTYAGFEYCVALQKAAIERALAIREESSNDTVYLATAWAFTNFIKNGSVVSAEWWQAFTTGLDELITNYVDHTESIGVNGPVYWDKESILEEAACPGSDDNWIRIPARYSTNATMVKGLPQRGDLPCYEWFLERHNVINLLRETWLKSKQSAPGAGDSFYMDAQVATNFHSTGSATSSWADAKSLAETNWAISGSANGDFSSGFATRTDATNVTNNVTTWIATLNRQWLRPVPLDLYLGVDHEVESYIYLIQTNSHGVLREVYSDQYPGKAILKRQWTYWANGSKNNNSNDVSVNVFTGLSSLPAWCNEPYFTGTNLVAESRSLGFGWDYTVYATYIASNVAGVIHWDFDFKNYTP